MAHDRRHLVSRSVAGLRAELSSLMEASVWSMGATETGATLRELTRLAAQVSELELRVAAHAERIGVEDASGATSTASWWAHVSHQTRREAHAKIALARALDVRHEPVRDALAEGAVLVEQAHVIVRAVDDLPDDLDPEVLALAEAELLRLAADHDAKALRILGRRILDVVAPEVAEGEEAKQVEKEEREAAASVRFTLSDDGHGRVHGRFTLPAAQGAMLRKALTALAAPKHLAATEGGSGERRPTPERMGRAFCEYVERYPAEALPASGGVNACVVVTLDLATLLGGSNVAALDTGETISAGQARRLACEAGLIPVVLGGRSEILDLGRRKRLHSKAQRVALGVRDGGCTADGCDWPPVLCHAHHDTPWSRGGGTSVSNGRLLCPRHHARAHDPTYRTQRLPGGKVAFCRRT